MRNYFFGLGVVGTGLIFGLGAIGLFELFPFVSADRLVWPIFFVSEIIVPFLIILSLFIFNSFYFW